MPRFSKVWVVITVIEIEGKKYEILDTVYDDDAVAVWDTLGGVDAVVVMVGDYKDGKDIKIIELKEIKD